ncbi:TerB family tellurite resistance protein [Streptomyces daliensis]|uniref:TerB family tellurite resistance protein n=1 Tax=Streptomyces daliensis TaxID=299421 RepID=A0A8T4IXW0_9ACTN|nr:TerB family tellurite resistance protein [Streptomyces daliensis]
MRRSRDPRARTARAERANGTGRVRVAGVRTVWHTVDDGDFFCPGCGGDRSYRRRTGHRRFVLLGVPLVPRGSAGPVLECAACRAHFGAEALDHPTTTRLAAMLRDAVHAVALAVLAAGGTEARAARETAVETVRAAGYPECSEEQLTALLAALGADSVPVEIELHEALAPLGPHLAPAGRESLLLQGARIALADGLYRAGERDVLAAVGAALCMDADDIERLLAEAARTPS